MVFRNEGERDSFKFRKQKTLQLISALHGVGSRESRNTEDHVARSIILRDEIDLRIERIRKPKAANLILEHNRTRVFQVSGHARSRCVTPQDRMHLVTESFDFIGNLLID